MKRILLLAALLLIGIATPARTQPAVRMPTVGSCDVTTSSSQCLGAVYRYNLSIENTSATATVACRFNGTAILNSKTSFMIYPGGVKTWHSQTDTQPPTGPINCIGTAAATIYLEYY